MTAHAMHRAARARYLWWAVVAMSLTAFSPSRLWGQISPGPLARAHADLEGATNCVQCHGLKREPMSQLCLACHKEIAWLMDKNRGFHGREVKQTKKECASCHPDHAGTAFKLIDWPDGSQEKFDHKKAGWLLEGKHADTKCEKCHTTKFRGGPAATLSKRKSNAGWVGLETDCVSCHKSDDVHKGDLKDRCESCHDAKDWTHAPKFEHDKSDYPLTGKHVDVECDKCHITPKLPVRTNAEGKRIGTFKPVPFKECSSCHNDPHQGGLGDKCSDCHTTRGFAVIDKSGFNHQLTKYPLRGKHLSVGCEKCHGQNLLKKTMPFARCIDCHADVHKGEATLAGKAVDCASCHKVEGFTPSTFTVAQHATSKYPLQGKHATVRCALCHTPMPATPASAAKVQRVARIRLDARKCSTCHADAHAGETAGRSDGGLCESCHTVIAFAPSAFDVKAHQALKVTLEGRHGQIECMACHGSTRPGARAVARTGRPEIEVDADDPREDLRRVSCGSARGPLRREGQCLDGERMRDLS
ncbi:MAG: cytochrome c3 family protein [Gemmatimonadaceae bacterium]